MNINDTILKFGYPDSLIRSYQHWSVLLRPQQVTLGSLIIAAHSEVTQFSHLKTEAMTELALVTADVEKTLKTCFQFDKINYLMLMMVDPHVHMHVIPRYESMREFRHTHFIDQDWPSPPNLSRQIEIDQAHRADLLSHIMQAWKN